MKNVYLAGPDVFRENAVSYGKRMVKMCEDRRLNGLFPLDNTATTSSEIYLANVELIKKSDAILANLDNFRGPECDSGTAWEVGFAIALGIPVYGYCIFPQAEYKHYVHDPYPNQEYPIVEDFGNRFNLMISESIIGPFHSFNSALNECAGDLHSKKDELEYR
jgi:nucleoside 2-deoxyribosyltransferase